MSESSEFVCSLVKMMIILSIKFTSSRVIFAIGTHTRVFSITRCL